MIRGAAKPNALGGAFFGLAAAALFGASAPIAKLLIPSTHPLMLSALLYLGAGFAISTWSLIRTKEDAAQEARLRSSDIPLLAGIIIFGGFLGPLLLLVGLSRVSGLVASLLLNLEAPFTILLAVLVFREHLDRRAKIASLVIVLGAALLGFRPGEIENDVVGLLSIACACLAWGIDNNLSQRLSLRDPIAVVRIKTLSAAACSFAISAVMRIPSPEGRVVLAAFLLGALSYGISLVFDMKALRKLGAAREAAYFATAPFMGAVLAIPLLGDRPTIADLVASALMITGVVVLRTERHVHGHKHEPIAHEHVHVHDEHHQHEHEHSVGEEPHSHIHVHEAITHTHEHVSDLHHRHDHP